MYMMRRKTVLVVSLFFVVFPPLVQSAPLRGREQRGYSEKVIQASHPIRSRTG